MFVASNGKDDAATRGDSFLPAVLLDDNARYAVAGKYELLDRTVHPDVDTGAPCPGGKAGGKRLPACHHLLPDQLAARALDDALHDSRERPQRPTRHQVHDPEIPTCDGHRNRRGNRFARAEDRGAAFDAVGAERLGLDHPADGGSTREVGKVVRVLVHVAELERRGGQNLVDHGWRRFDVGLAALARSGVAHEVVQVGHYALLRVDRAGLPQDEVVRLHHAPASHRLYTAHVRTYHTD